MYYDANLSIFTLVFKCLIYFNYAITNIIFTARQGGSIKIFKLGVSVWREQRHLPLCTDSNSTYICLYSIYTDTASIQLLYRICTAFFQPCLYTAFFQPRFASIQPLLNIHLPLSKLQSTFIWLFTTSIWPSFNLHPPLSDTASIQLLYRICTVSFQPRIASIQYTAFIRIHLPLNRLQSTFVCLYTTSI